MLCKCCYWWIGTTGCIKVDSVTTHWQDNDLQFCRSCIYPVKDNKRYRCMKERKKKQTKKIKQGLINARAINIIDLKERWPRWRGTVASWLAWLSLDQAIWVPALVGDNVMCSWARHFTLMVSLSTRCINGHWQNVGGNPAMDYYPI